MKENDSNGARSTHERRMRNVYIRGPFEKFVDCRKCSAVMHREAVTVMPSFSGRDNVVVA
jgi:hypothetical protein